jgi:hypothetical protein
MDGGRAEAAEQERSQDGGATSGSEPACRAPVLSRQNNDNALTVDLAENGIEGADHYYYVGDEVADGDCF